jgi:hypothetical protein
MKFWIRPAVLLVSIAVAALILLPGCATSKTERGPEKVATLQSVKDDFDLVAVRAEEAEDALIELKLSPDIDLDQAFHAFSVSTDRLLEAGKSMIAHADAMYYVGEPYIVESEKTLTACVYPRIPVPGDKQPAELGRYFDTISDQSWEVKRAYRAYQSDIRLIRNSLADILTPATRESISFMFEKARVDSDSLVESLDKASATMEQAKTAIAQRGAKGN